MRWLWRRTPPGMVRIKERDLIALQRDALRAYELEHTTRELQAERARLEAQVLLADLTEAEREAAAEVVSVPPLTAKGDLHEPAFAAAVDAAVWAHRERELAELTATRTD